MSDDVTVPVKYPRTSHLSISESLSSDDRRMRPEDEAFLGSGVPLVVTEKMDGGNLTFTRDHFYARSIDGTSHLWDTWAKGLWGAVRFDIPDGWRISGESLYARRSVRYENLTSFYLVFGVWDETNTLLNWDDTTDVADALGLDMVPTLYRGTDFREATTVWFRTKNPETSEGFVIRHDSPIHHDEFPAKVGKYVRANHVRTSDDWRNRDDFTLNAMNP